MQKKSKTWLIPVGVVIIAILIWLLKGCGDGNKIKDSDRADFKYRTKTIYRTSYKSVPVTTFIEVPPKTVIVYKEKPGVAPDAKIIYRDTGYIKVVPGAGRTDTVLINPAFLTNWPSNPKLLKAGVKKQELNLDLYYPDGVIKGFNYPLNLDKYDYVWEDEMFKAVPKSSRFRLKDIKGSSDAAVLYDPFNQTGRLELDYTLRYKRIGVTAEPYGLHSFKDKSWSAGVNAGIKYRLK